MPPPAIIPLPHEILQHIIEFCHEQAIQISHVSRSFRDAAISLSILWSAIHIDSSFPSTLERAAIYYQRTIKSTARISLSLRISTSPTAEEHTEILVFLKACGPRLRTLNITYASDRSNWRKTKSAVRNLVVALHDVLATLDAPHLCQLQYNAQDMPGFGTSFMLTLPRDRTDRPTLNIPSNFPLKTLTVLGLRFKYNQNSTFDRLTSLILDHIPETTTRYGTRSRRLEDFFEIQGLQGLQRLELHGWCNDYRPIRQILLPNLQELTILHSSASFAGRLLSHLKAPSLEAMTISLKHMESHGLDDGGLHPSVKTLTILLSATFFSFLAFRYTSHLRDLNRVFRQVQSLRLCNEAICEGELQRLDGEERFVHMNILGSVLGTGAVLRDLIQYGYMREERERRYNPSCSTGPGMKNNEMGWRA